MAEIRSDIWKLLAILPWCCIFVSLTWYHLEWTCSNSKSTLGITANHFYFIGPLLLDLNLLDMEDQHTLILSLKEDKDAAFFAVFDGHGGMLHSWFSFISFINTNMMFWSKGGALSLIRLPTESALPLEIVLHTIPVPLTVLVPFSYLLVSFL